MYRFFIALVLVLALAVPIIGWPIHAQSQHPQSQAEFEEQIELAQDQIYLQKMYGQYNHKYFDDKLPKDTQVHFVEHVKLSDLAEGDTLPPRFTGNPTYVIEISYVWNPQGNEALMTLFHEMCHVYLEQTKPDYHGDHDADFQRLMIGLADQHAFDDLW